MLYDKRWELDEIGKALLDAAEALRRDGWCQGYLHDPYGGHCLLGAIDIARRRVVIADPGLLLRMMERLSAHLPPGDRIMRWNDAPGRTVEEVISVLERAAYGK